MIASLYVLDRVWVARLAAGAPVPEVLVDQARAVEPGYGWSGHCLLLLVEYLDEHGIHLQDPTLAAEEEAINDFYDATYLLAATNVHAIDPAAHDGQRIAAYFAENGLDFDEAGLAGLDGLTLLHGALTRLEPGEVLLLHVG